MYKWMKKWKKGNSKNKNVKIEMRVCDSCNQNKKRKAFTNIQWKSNNPKCEACRTNAQKKYVRTQFCSQCGLRFPQDGFTPDEWKRASGLLDSGICKECLFEENLDRDELKKKLSQQAESSDGTLSLSQAGLQPKAVKSPPSDQKERKSLEPSPQIRKKDKPSVIQTEPRNQKKVVQRKKRKSNPFARSLARHRSRPKPTSPVQQKLRVKPKPKPKPVVSLEDIIGKSSDDFSDEENRHDAGSKNQRRNSSSSAAQFRKHSPHNIKRNSISPPRVNVIDEDPIEEFSDDPQSIWTCPQCTLQNEISVKRCGACDLNNPHFKQKNPRKRPRPIAPMFNVAAQRKRIKREEAWREKVDPNDMKPLPVNKRKSKSPSSKAKRKSKSPSIRQLLKKPIVRRQTNLVQTTLGNKVTSPKAARVAATNPQSHKVPAPRKVPQFNWSYKNLSRIRSHCEIGEVSPFQRGNINRFILSKHKELPVETRLPGNGYISQMKFGPNGVLLCATSTSGAIQVYQAHRDLHDYFEHCLSGETSQFRMDSYVVRTTNPSRVDTMDWSQFSGEAKIAVGGNSKDIVNIHDLAQKKIRSLRKPSDVSRMFRNGITTVKYYNNSNCIAAGTKNGAIFRWDARSKKVLKTLSRGEQHRVVHIHETETGSKNILECLHHDGTLKSWDVRQSASPISTISVVGRGKRIDGVSSVPLGNKFDKGNVRACSNYSHVIDIYYDRLFFCRYDLDTKKVVRQYKMHDSVEMSENMRFLSKQFCSFDDYISFPSQELVHTIDLSPHAKATLGLEIYNQKRLELDQFPLTLTRALRNSFHNDNLYTQTESFAVASTLQFREHVSAVTKHPTLPFLYIGMQGNLVTICGTGALPG